MSSQNYYTSKRWLRIIEVLLLLLTFNMPGGTQPLHDTLHITQTGNYPVTKHLWIYRTEKKLEPAQVYNLLRNNCFNHFGVKESLNESNRVVAFYWLVFTAINNRAYDETFYFWFNSPGLGRISVFRKNFSYGEIKFFRFEGVTGFYVPFNLRQNKSFDAEFGLQLQKGETATFLMQLENIDGENAFLHRNFLMQLPIKANRNAMF